MAIGTGTAILGGAALGLLGANKQASAAERGAQMQSDAANRAAALQEKQYADLAPYRESGQIGLNKIQEMLPYFTREVTAEDLRRMPGFEFGLNQGTGAAGQAMNVGGGGSNVDLARTKFATDYATNVGLPQYIAQRTGIYNTLANIAGIGQKSQEQSGNIASNIGQLGVGSATALGAGQIGASNAMAGALGGFGNALTLSSLLNPQNTSNYQLGSPSSIGGGIGQRTGLDMGGAQGLIIRPA
jgi:hypothetical protein